MEINEVVEEIGDNLSVRACVDFKVYGEAVENICVFGFFVR